MCRFGVVVAVTVLFVWSFDAVAAIQSYALPITSLPGFSGEIPFRQYSGYVNVDNNFNMFFWFVESQNDPMTDPVVLWLTGGPGCSSLYGMFFENGPFHVNKSASEHDHIELYLNPYSWNNVANMIYLESPCGVGFSYSDDGNYTTGDNLTAEVAYAFLIGFFTELFPEFSLNPFFIAGESYSGHYTPQLAYQIAIHKPHVINFRGFLVGNPTTDGPTDANAYFPFMAYHTLISESELDMLSSLCDGGQFYPPPSQACNDLENNLTANVNLINPYNIYAECLGGGPSPGGCLTQQRALADAALGFVDTPRPFSQTFIPCMDIDHIAAFFNLPSVQRSIHVSPDWSLRPWAPCSSYVNYVQYAPTVVPIYQELVEEVVHQGAPWRFLVYSGDVDMCVPFLATERSVTKFGFEVTSAWRPWTITLRDGKDGTQVAGYVVGYENGVLQYATVKDAGHFVPFYKPKQALEMFVRFLNGVPL